LIIVYLYTKNFIINENEITTSDIESSKRIIIDGMCYNNLSIVVKEYGNMKKTHVK